MAGQDYRADIDGLRAVAVLGVLLYHVRGFGVSGGYGGVDVFFVISGFLITGILWREMEGGTFSLVGFLERRARRIAPAALLMLTATLIIGSILLLPRELEDLGKSLQSVIVFSANFFFLRNVGYFAPGAEERPLLHMWSLSIEEQFYLAFPLALLILVRLFGRKVVLPILLVAFAASFAESVRLVESVPAKAFFGTAGRIWELLLGSILAIASATKLLRPSREIVAQGAALAGLGLISYGYLCFNNATEFPGANAAVFCGGAALIIFAGLSGHTTIVGKLLGSRLLVGIGLISYSCYLWHWPLIVYWRYRFPSAGGEALGLEQLGLVGASLIVGALSWQFVERPFRGRDALFSRAQLFTALGAGTALVAALSFVAIRTHGLPSRWPAEVVAMLAESAAPDHELCKPFADAPQWARQTCTMGEAAKSDIFVWGDSHARVLIGPLSDRISSKQPGIQLAWLGGCPPLAGAKLYGRTKFEKCQAFNAYVLKQIEALKPHRVVIAARWAHYFQDDLTDFDGGVPIQLSADGEPNAQVAGRLLRETLERLLAAAGEVVLVGPVPEQDFLVAPRMAKGMVWPQPLPPPVSIARHRVRQRDVVPALEAMAKLPRVRVLDPESYLCNANSCAYDDGGLPLYFDSNHLNAHGVAKLMPLIDELVK